MSRIKRLTQSYGRFISVPWQELAAPQRVIFCVYNEEDERLLRAKIDEFEIVTRQAGHEWAVFDQTDSFALWLGNQRYKKSYFKNPELITVLLPQYLTFIGKEFNNFIQEQKITKNTVVALKGVGSLFGFVKVKEVVDLLAPVVKGKLLVFFPGTYDENNNYRLLDGYDGWNYLAVPIIAEKDESQ